MRGRENISLRKISARVFCGHLELKKRTSGIGENTLLPPLDRTLVDLFYMEERPIREVAAICGESESNVKTRLHRARGRLRELMNSRFTLENLM